MIWFSSDFHFYHNREFIYNSRGFNNVAEMNETIIQKAWEKIDSEDDFYILGDLMLNDNEAGLRLIKQLPGKLHIILGNHDTDARVELYKTCHNVWSVDIARIIKAEGYSFYLSHYPTVTTNFDDNKKMRARLLNLCGHCHTKEIWDNITHSHHVEVDNHNCYPWSLEEIITNFKSLKDNK